jgi:mRNA interferase MazF
MTRGDVVIVSLAGDYGKPRPVLVIQSDLLAEHPSVTVLAITDHLVEAPLLRIGIGPESRPERVSEIQIDKAQTPRRQQIGGIIGQADKATLAAVNRGLAVSFSVWRDPAFAAAPRSAHTRLGDFG